MMRTILAVFGVCAAFAASQGAVARGPVVNPANGHIYYQLAASSWTAAAAEASAMGGHLATVNDLAESLWLTQTFSDYDGDPCALWIGLNDAAEEGTFRWSTGEALTFENWRRSYPVDPIGNADYVMLEWSNSVYPGQWRNVRDDDFNTPGLPVCGVVEIVPPGAPLQIQTAVELSWLSVLHRNYQVQWADRLSPEAWSNLGEPKAGTGEVISIFEPARVAATRFYRVLEVLVIQ